MNDVCLIAAALHISLLSQTEAFQWYHQSSPIDKLERCRSGFLPILKLHGCIISWMTLNGVVIKYFH
jgi:hypothetical protein